MDPAVFVFDNFYVKPDEVRDIVATEFEWEDKSADRIYPGQNTIDPYVEDFHHEVFRTFTGAYPEESGLKLFGNFNKCFLDSTAIQNIHYNLGEAWIALVYLSKDHDDERGTTFWRHNETGLTQAPIEMYDYINRGLKGPELAYEKLCVKEGLDKNLWTESDVIKYRYNRLVIFRGNKFHDYGDMFDDRLTQVFMWSVFDSDDEEYKWWKTLGI